MAYRAMWRDLVAASATSDAGSPLLDDHATDGALELIKHGLKNAKKEKVVVKGTPRINPEVVMVAAHKVRLRDCVDGTDWLQYRLDGKLKNDVPGSHFRTDATVLRKGSVWKVSYLYMHDAGTC
ncbi:hypothetical protein PS467_09425 [Streptomyces luomodiensis]|uniref:SnoaL-like domain-containing protein n=1 Tax=Streptomyces luomodiensis TaxID=3026192 RepID=A0ABY9UTE3_9ACTN|nr:hypothetical protein [Streptomyces sp. SCA4-21]WNE95546.1 hypothetical protein PS467_09425 [Streptomyces sp. SCA4-21]